MTDAQLSQEREQTRQLILNWATTGRGELTMRSQVNRYMEHFGCNNSTNEETVLGHRRLVAQRLTIDCINPLSREQLAKVERELNRIAENDASRQRRGWRM